MGRLVANGKVSGKMGVKFSQTSKKSKIAMNIPPEVSHIFQIPENFHPSPFFLVVYLLLKKIWMQSNYKRKWACLHKAVI